LEFLDISLNTWSLIVFLTQVLMITSIFIMFISVTTGSFIFMTIMWFLAQLTFLAYGIETDQIGFVFLFIFNIIITFIGIFVKLDSTVEEDND